MQKQTKNVTQWFDDLKLNRFHVLLVLLVAITLIFDGYDSQIIAYIMPHLVKEWNLNPIVAGSVASYGFFGLMVGASGFGMISDRIGRKKSLMLAVAIFSTFSGISYFAPDFKTFVTLRFLAGIGMGGAMPIAITLISEFAPAKIRAKAVTTMFGGFTLGWAVAGLMAMLIIPTNGWRPLLLIGLIPIAIIPLIALYLPESVRFLVSKKRYDEAIREIHKIEKLACLEPTSWSAENLFQEETKQTNGIQILFSPSLKRMTILIWITYFFNLLVVYGLSSWLPSLLVKNGFSMVKSYSFGIVQAVGATVGGFILGWVMDKFGRKAGLSLFYILGGISLWVFGFATSNTTLLIAGAATGIFIIGTQIAQHVIAGEIYPTHARSTGIGYALTIGRLGSIVGPLMGGYIQQMGQFSFGQYFVIFSIPAFLCGILVLFYKVNVKGDALETVHQKLSAISLKTEIYVEQEK